MSVSFSGLVKNRWKGINTWAIIQGNMVTVLNDIVLIINEAVYLYLKPALLLNASIRVHSCMPHPPL